MRPVSALAVIVVCVTTALYRRYRPETFADVIGQEHVTEPLMQALRTGRTGHAYLFSGPRGCGKTTSARILARCLNCAQGPTPTPCGECDSCVALARGGSGSVDVIEIDAASHGGVDDARDLRERASYGPAQSRYKIYIIDEAHMVTPQGFNALLKIVEEPPEHVKFVFATTEPEKVIGTIRSRTHHYPFRLVPPGLLSDYMQGLCDQEGVRVEPGVLSFVTRAGGGSVRDSLSVLDQLIAGSTEEGLTYTGAAALLGFTDGELLDAVVDALAAHDGAAVFRQIDKVIESGHDPRRFIEDLLERLRDLIVVAAVPEGAAQVLRTVPEDQIERMRQQAAAFGAGALSRAADIANTGLTEMTGATAPRLQLELIAARILLPASSGEQGYAARLDRLERRLDLGEARSSVEPVETTSPPRSDGGGAAVTPSHSVLASQPPEPGNASRADVPGNAGRVGEPPRASRIETTSSVEPRSSVEFVETSVSTSSTSEGSVEPVEATSGPPPATPQVADDGWPDDGAAAQTGPPAEDVPPEPDATSAAPDHAPAVRQPGAIDTDAVRRAWPDILDRIFNLKRVTWALLSQHAHVVDYDGQRLMLGTSTQGLADTFRRGQHPDVVHQAVLDAIGVDCRVEAIAQDGDSPSSTDVGPPPPGGGQPPAGSGGPDRNQRPSGGAPGGSGGSGARPAATAPPAGAPRPPTSNAAAEIGGATPPGGWDADSRDSWGSPAGPPPDWATGGGGSEADSTTVTGGAGTASAGSDAGGAAAGSGAAGDSTMADGSGTGTGTGGGSAGGIATTVEAPHGTSDVSVPASAGQRAPEGNQTDVPAPGTAPVDSAQGAAASVAAPGASADAPNNDVRVDAAKQTSTSAAASPRQRAEQRVRENAASAAAVSSGPAFDDTAVDFDDESIEDASDVGLPVIQSVLGGTIIAEENG